MQLHSLYIGVFVLKNNIVGHLQNGQNAEGNVCKTLSISGSTWEMKYLSHPSTNSCTSAASTHLVIQNTQCTSPPMKLQQILNKIALFLWKEKRESRSTSISLMFCHFCRQKFQDGLQFYIGIFSNWWFVNRFRNTIQVLSILCSQAEIICNFDLRRVGKMITYSALQDFSLLTKCFVYFNFMQ